MKPSNQEAMDLLNSGLRTVIKNTADIVFSLMKEEFLLIYDVKKHVEKLKENLITFNHVVKEAEKLRLEESNFRPWLMKLKDAMYDADDILDTFATEVCLWKRKQMGDQLLKNPSGGLRKILKKSEISKKVREVSEKLDEIARERDLFNFGIYNGGGGGRRLEQQHEATGSSIDIGNVIGRDDDKENLVKLLLSDEYSREGEVSVVQIIGMGGLGKTTLAQYVYNDERVKEYFKPTMWVCVTADYEFKRILRDMIESHSKMAYSDELAVDFLESRLLEILTGNKFLLVLDDVWIPDCKQWERQRERQCETQWKRQWERLQTLLKKGDKGSKVLVTSRSLDVRKVMGTQEPFRLGYLPDDQCWSLFEKIAFVSSNMPRDLRRELEDIGKQIVSKCRGLPLAVKSIAGLLRNSTDVAKWQDILGSSMWELDDEDQNSDQTPNILPVLKLSYDHLPSHLKQCFYYCSIFPKAHVFVKEDLVKLWVAQGYVRAVRRKSAEENGIEYFHGLLARFFFETAKIENHERYRMHDLIHDLAQSISSPHCCQVKDFRPGNCLQDVGCTSETRHISVLDRKVKEPALAVATTCGKARTLLFPMGDKKDFGGALTKIFTSLKMLRALDLSSSVLLELPSAIEELKLLRYLDLSTTEIKVLPDSICNLYNLQVLKLLGCVWLFRLPADFSKLVNLSYLELDRMFWFKCSVLPPRIGNLSKLRNWHAFHVGREDGYRISELGNMASLMGTLHISRVENVENAIDANLGMKKDLRKLVLEWSIDRGINPVVGAAEERVLEDLQPHKDISELQIDSYTGGRIPTWMIGDHLQNLVTLSLNHCTRFRILSLGHLTRLTALFIKGLQELEELSEKGGLSSLQRLTISHCPRLRKLPEVLPNLRVLKIKMCDTLQALPITPSLNFSILIDNLALEDWKERVCQITFQDDQQQLVNQTWPSFVKLIELKVINCPKLRDLPKHFAPQKLEIHQCESINSLPPTQLAQRFQHLALDGRADDTLVKAIPKSNSLYSLVISNISNLTSFPSWPELPGLKALYISNCQDLLSLPESGIEGSLQSLTSLKLLSIRGLPELTALPVEGLPTNLECLIIASCSSLQSLGGPQTIRNLTSLKDLYIENCPLLESFPEDGVHENLKHLCIKGCPRLHEHCQDRNIIMNCDLEIEYIKPPSTSDYEQTLQSSPTTAMEQMIQRCLPCHQVFLRCLGL